MREQVDVLSWKHIVSELRNSSYSDVLGYLTPDEIDNGFSLERLREIRFSIYDEVVTVHQKHRLFMKQVSNYYNHPIWILTALWHESSAFAVKDRLNIVELVTEYDPENMLDMGGGIGMLSRLISIRRPSIQIDLADLSDVQSFSKIHLKDYKNITFVNSPRGLYSSILSSEVLEHIPDPIKEVIKINRLLTKGGYLFATWSFNASEKSHIRANFYLDKKFQFIVCALGFQMKRVAGRAFTFQKYKDASIVDCLKAYAKAWVLKLSNYIRIVSKKYRVTK